MDITAFMASDTSFPQISKVPLPLAGTGHLHLVLSLHARTELQLVCADENNLFKSL